MSTFIRKVMPACIAILMAFCFVSLIGMEDAHAEAKNAGTITLDFTKGTQRLSGDELEAFNNVMDALYNAGIIYYLDFSAGSIYDLGNNRSYEFEKHDEEGYSEFRMLDDATIKGEWSMKKIVDARSVEEIKNSLIAQGKAYCDDIRIIFPEIYDVWVEGVKLNSVNAKDVKGDGTVKYDGASKTLTLNGATLEVKGMNASPNSAGIFSYDKLNLVLKGTNKVKLDVEPYTQDVYGVKAKDLTVTGAGTLEVDITSKDRHIYGLNASDFLAIDGATVRTKVENENNGKHSIGLKAGRIVTIQNGANVNTVSKGAQGAANTVAGVDAYGLTVDESSILESASDKQVVSLWSNNENIDPDTKSRGAWVNSEATAEGAIEWNKTDPIQNFKYVRMPYEHTVHHWDSGKVTKKATPTSTGIMSYTCTACGKTKTEAIAKIPKYANTLKVSGKTAVVKYKKLKKAPQKLAAKKVIKFTNAGQGTKSYKLVSAKKGSKNFKKYFKINAKTGQVTVKKKLKKGTYKVRATVNAAGNASYKASVWKTVNFKVTVK